MKKTTNQEPNNQTIECLIHEAMAEDSSKAIIIMEFFQRVLQKYQTQGYLVEELQRITNDHLNTILHCELQAQETYGKAVSAGAAPEATEDKAARVVPEVLRTPEAAALLNKAVAAGWLDERWQPTVSSTMAALLAMRLAVILKIENQWQVFGELWNRNSGTLRSNYNTAMSQKQTRAFLGQMNEVLIR